MTLLTSLHTEILKTKRTASFYLSLIAAAFGPFFSILDIFIGEGISANDRGVMLNKLFIDKFEMTGVLTMPLFIILICTLLQQIEYKNNTWKQVLTAPQSRASIFIAKFLNLQLLIVLFLVANFCFMCLSAAILNFKDPSLHLFSQSLDGYGVLAARLNSYMVLLAMCCIQFWLGLRFKNFIIPMAIGLACWFAGSLLVLSMKSAAGAYFPYSFHVYTALPDLLPQLNHIRWASFAYAVLFLGIGFWDFSRRRMIG